MTETLSYKNYKDYEPVVAEMLALLKQLPIDQRFDALALVCRVAIETKAGIA